MSDRSRPFLDETQKCECVSWEWGAIVPVPLFLASLGAFWKWGSSWSPLHESVDYCESVRWYESTESFCRKCISVNGINMSFILNMSSLPSWGQRNTNVPKMAKVEIGVSSWRTEISNPSLFQVLPFGSRRMCSGGRKEGLRWVQHLNSMPLCSSLCVDAQT